MWRHLFVNHGVTVGANRPQFFLTVDLIWFLSICHPNEMVNVNVAVPYPRVSLLKVDSANHASAAICFEALLPSLRASLITNLKDFIARALRMQIAYWNLVDLEVLSSKLNCIEISETPAVLENKEPFLYLSRKVTQPNSFTT